MRLSRRLPPLVSGRLQSTPPLRSVARAFASGFGLSDDAWSVVETRLGLASTVAENAAERSIVVANDGMAALSERAGLVDHDHMLFYHPTPSDRTSLYVCPKGLSSPDRFELLIRAIQSVTLFETVLDASSKPPKDRFAFGPTPIEIGDYPVNVDGVVAYGRKVGAGGIVLIPDFYYGLSGGYRIRKVAQFPDWRSKACAAVWRGSTTGFGGLTTANVRLLPRHRLCEAASKRADGRLDCRFVLVGQAASEQEAADIERDLRQDGLWSERMSQEDMAGHRFLIDIDGNANSWSLLEKMHYGACILKVGSPFEQWFYAELKPWKHFVPVRADLSDLDEMLDWCLANDRACREIAGRAARFAKAMAYPKTMARAFERVRARFGQP